MNKEVLETQWVQAKEFLRDRWSKLTEEDVRQINGRYDLLVDKLHQRYGYTTEQAEEEIRRWNLERSTPRSGIGSERTYSRQEDRTVREDDSSSLFKWLLALAIPLALLALYFGTTRTPEVVSPTAPQGAAFEEIMVFTETPADLTLGQTIRQSLANSPLVNDLRTVRISTSNGIVTVTGTVANTRQSERIENALRNISGVRQVNNQLEIRQ